MGLPPSFSQHNIHKELALKENRHLVGLSVYSICSKMSGQDLLKLNAKMQLKCEIFKLQHIVLVIKTFAR